jgi:hypothetical protein
MKMILALGILISSCISTQASASGCLSDSFYDLKEVAKSAGVDACYFEKLSKISEPQSMADRQYNYFAEKINEYVSVVGAKAIDLASLEFIFYPEIRRSSLASQDARKVNFSYTQSYSCQKQREEIMITAKINVFGIVGLTGVCLTREKIEW